MKYIAYQDKGSTRRTRKAARRGVYATNRSLHTARRKPAKRVMED